MLRRRRWRRRRGRGVCPGNSTDLCVAIRRIRLGACCVEVLLVVVVGFGGDSG